MAAQVLPIDTIVCDPDVRGGRPIVAGTSLRVSDIAAYHIYEGLTAEELAVQIKLDLAQVHAALSYYFAHRGEIQAEIQENSVQAEKWRQVLSPKAS